MNTLVTGGAGFIGSNLVDALLKAGHSVTVIDNLSTGCEQNLTDALSGGTQLIEADIRDGSKMQEIVSSVKPSYIFHLAAQIDVRKSVADCPFDATVNVVGTINMLDAALKGQVQRLIYISTGGAIYGDAETIPTPEEAPIQPLAPYGQAKFAGEGYCQLYQRLHGLSTISLRLGNVYGPRQDPLGEAGVIAIFCGRLKGGERPTVYGDGQQTRDYIHVSDVVAANIAAAESELSGPVNIGTGRQTSVLELIEALKPAAEHDFEPVFEPPRSGEVLRGALDATRAKKELGWQAEVGLSEGIEQTLASTS